MPKVKHNEAPEERSARFHAKVERMIATGELSCSANDATLDDLIRVGARAKILQSNDE
ncbi:hypothetical protein H0274_01615 [Altererythrobacter sp. CC-YST694]|uniref:hypothetical protein n=1 Tax=Altererythrobacter sp. CC-YST694 TaxID=2755038 RepID=UPI001D00D295|nr:hypothetical protein [Altererythrobacter sp. CC-YST694]MCB5423942.1 hypothetical protein [Altererythrobacter sp. CC-YST694]